MKKKTGKQDTKISPELARMLGEGDGEYALSSAFSGSVLRRFYGEWEVVEHRVDGQAYLERFREHVAKSLRARDAEYLARYTFKENICAKRVMIQGTLELPEGLANYSYRMAMALSWGILPDGVLRVRPELGYHSSYLDGVPTAADELAASADEDLLLSYRFEDGDLVLEEGEDYKRLRRISE